MASTANTSTIAALNAIVDACDGGSGPATIRFYSGTVPTDCDTALSGNTLLAELTMSDPAFGNATDDTPGAIAVANAITDDTTANATGTATFARILDSNGVPLIQLTVSATGGGGEVEINSAAIQANATVKVTSLSIFMPD